MSELHLSNGIYIINNKGGYQIIIQTGLFDAHQQPCQNKKQKEGVSKLK